MLVVSDIFRASPARSCYSFFIIFIGVFFLFNIKLYRKFSIWLQKKTQILNIVQSTL